MAKYNQLTPLHFSLNYTRISVITSIIIIIYNWFIHSLIGHEHFTVFLLSGY